MKEKIYTIPINEALEANGFCPFCYMHRVLEDDAIRYTVGPAMMESDFRIITNEKGFCQKHMSDLCAMSKALPLSLVLQSHLISVLALLDADVSTSTKSIFKKSASPKADFAASLEMLSDSCTVCERIEHTFSRYISSFIYMLKKEKGFLDKVLATEGFCMLHFSNLASAAAKELSDSEYQKLFVPIIALQKERISKYHTYITNFANSFDYRNAFKPIEAPKDVIHKTAELLNGEFVLKDKKLDDI